MDISKASNFERYMFDVVGRDPDALRALWTQLDRDGEFSLARTDLRSRVVASGFVSGTSTHADRIATIRDVHRRYGLVIDPHTADGVKVGREYRDASVPLICLETALPAKFAATIREALDVEPPRPAAFVDIESRPQHCERLPADPAHVAAYVARHAGDAGAA